MSPWLNDYTIELVCPSDSCAYKSVKKYDSFLEMANELHTDIKCPECGESFTIEEHLLYLR